MPEPAELCLRGGERRGVQVPEADDGDAGDEVEVASALGVGEPRALAGDEGDVRRRVGRQYGGARHGHGHASTAVSPISAARRARRGTAARSLGTIPPSSSPPESRGRPRPPRSPGRRPLAQEPGTSVTKRSRSAPRPTASAAAASSAFTFSGPAASGATTGIFPSASASSTGADGGDRLADQAELRDRRRVEADLVAEQADGARTECRTEGAFASSERAPHDRQPGGRRDAPPADELDRTREALHLRGDLRPGAVDDADLVPRWRERMNRGSRVGDRAAALTTSRLTSGSPR